MLIRILILSIVLLTNTPVFAYMECITSTDCYFLYVPRKIADGYSRDTTLTSASPADDIDVFWFYEDDTTATEITEGNQIDTCPPGASQACLTQLGNGVYKIGIDAVLNNESGKRLCVDVRDVQGTRTVSDEVLCNYIYVQDRIIDTDNIGINWGDISNPTTTQNLSGTSVLISDGIGEGQIDTLSGSIVNVDLADTCTAVTNGVTLSAAATSAQLVDDMWDEPYSAHITAGTYSLVYKPIQSSAAQAVAAGTITLSTGASASNDYYNNLLVVITNATAGAGQVRKITAYDGTTKVATLDANWVITPTGTVQYMVTPDYSTASGSLTAQNVWEYSTRVLTAGTNIALAKGTGVTGFNDLSSLDVSTAVWNAATATYGSAGSYGLLIETNLDTNIGSRMATYTQPTGFLTTTFPSGTVASTTNITAGTIASVTNDIGITQTGADKVWGTATRTITGGTIGTYTGNTLQTGDSFARIGVAGAGLTDLGGMSTTMKAQIETEATDALNAYDPPTRTEATADKDAILARTPSATAIPNINAAYDGTGYAGQAIKVVIATTTETWKTIPLVETGVILVSNDHVGKWLFCGLQEPKKIVKTVQGATDTVTIAPGDPFSPTPSGLTCYIN